MGSPILWVDQDFDANLSVEVNNAAIPLAQNLGSWCGRSVAGAGSSNLTWLQVDNVLGHLGILRIPTGTTSGNTSALFLARDSQAGGPSASEAHIPMANFFAMEAWVRVPTITSINVRIGLGQNVDSSTSGTDAFAFDFDPTNSANWQVLTRAASTNTVTDTGIAVTAGTWYRLTLRAPGRRFEFGVNQSLIGSEYTNPCRIGGLTQVSSNLPTVNMVLGAWLRTNTAAARNFDIDRIRVWLDDEGLVG